MPLASQSHCGVDLDSCAFNKSLLSVVITLSEGCGVDLDNCEFSKSLLLSLSERAVMWT